MSDQQTFGAVVNRAARLLRRLADQRLAPLGLSSGYLPVLAALRAGPLSQKALTEWAGIEQPTMAATLARMVRDGIISREPDPDDKRSTRFALTPGTRDKGGSISSAVERLNEDALASLGQAERAELHRFLEAIILSVQHALGERS